MGEEEDGDGCYGLMFERGRCARGAFLRIERYIIMIVILRI